LEGVGDKEARLGERQSLPDNGLVARIPDAVLDTLRERLAQRPEILEAYLFGSQARGEAMAHSDIDIAVYVDREHLPPAPWGYAADLTTDLMSALGRKDIDVVVLNGAPPLLYHRVLRDGERLLSRDLAATTTREGYAVSRYCDYLPVLRRIDRELARRLEDGSFGR
jgi:predicted nucleotidyltransferase